MRERASRAPHRGGAAAVIDRGRCDARARAEIAGVRCVPRSNFADGLMRARTFESHTRIPRALQGKPNITRLSEFFPAVRRGGGGVLMRRSPCAGAGALLCIRRGRAHRNFCAVFRAADFKEGASRCCAGRRDRAFSRSAAAAGESATKAVHRGRGLQLFLRKGRRGVREKGVRRGIRDSIRGARRAEVLERSVDLAVLRHEDRDRPRPGELGEGDHGHDHERDGQQHAGHAPDRSPPGQRHDHE